MTAEFELRPGWVGEELAAEFPELRLIQTVVPLRPGRSPRTVKHRLKVMSDRFTGPKAVQVRQQPVPWAYRVFFRQIGIDPDRTQTPAEAIALERMRAGEFASRGVLHDALLIGMVETGVPLLAYDSERVSGGLGLRLATAGERLGESGRDLRGGEIVVADEARALAVLFGDEAAGYAPHVDTRRVLLAAVQVKGVPDVSAEEALWTAAETLAEAP
ncbi:MAG TPA: phenylalanine--tRNA ligase beta subunit-related protein [Thermoleophilaceae bacterium]|nr:phenylalanine--tRNA ligase beta subunit-related protein [Thermoleophilaceae bacterium]